MATVNKNFRVKNGLVVEGSTATVNGQNILTETGSDNYIINLIGGTATSANTANTVVKRDGSGNFSAGTITANLTGNVTGNLTGNVTGNVTGTVSDISNHTTTALTEGTNQYFTDARAKNSAADLLTGANLTNITITGTGAGLTITAENGVADSTTDDLAEGSTRLYFTNARARQAISGGTGISYDNSTGVISLNTNTDGVSEGASNLYFTNGRARASVSVNNTGLTYDQSTGTFGVAANTFDTYLSASNAQAAANSYTDSEIAALRTDDIAEDLSPINLWFTDARARAAVSAGSGLSYNGGTGEFSVDTSVIANKTYVDTAITNLVDGAPGLLDTLNEIAAAINDDANYFTTVANNIATKLSLAGGTMTGAITLHADPVNALHAATKQYVDQAETDAVASAASYTDSAIAAGNAVAEPVYAAIDFNGIAKNVAATVSVPTAGAVTAYQWNHNAYKSGKFTVKVANGTHTELSEILVTSDTSQNIHMTEYGVVGTNGSLSTITVDHDNNNFRVRVTTANNNSTVTIAGTLIA